MADRKYKTIACAQCGASVSSTGNRQRYCAPCANAMSRARCKLYVAKYRLPRRKEERPDAPCQGCGKLLKQGLRGRAKRYCSYKCNPKQQYVKATLSTKFCVVCSKEFFVLGAGQQKYCSRKCKDSIRDRRDSPSLLTLPLDSPSRFVCEHCGVASARHLGGSNIKRGLKNRFCSMACKKQASSENREPRFSKVKPCLDCGSFVKARFKRCSPCAKLLAIAAYHPKPAHEASCVICLKGFLSTRNASYCSHVCYRKSEAHQKQKQKQRNTPNSRASKLRSKSLRRARERHNAERFDPFEIFERDGWLCRMCGVVTPKELRGTYALAAPELDHIQPLARGGLHVRANAQCLCRGCNLAKADYGDGEMVERTLSLNVPSSVEEDEQFKRDLIVARARNRARQTRGAPKCLIQKD